MKYKKYFRKTSLKQKKHNSFFLNEISFSKPKFFLEIGVFHGVTARNVCELLYQIHKLITFFFTGKSVNFGNFSCLTKNDIKKISIKKSLWSSFSGTLKYHIKNLNSINSVRGSRYFGPSKMSLFNLIIHSFSIIAVFKTNVFFRSIILIIIASYLISLAPVIVSIFQILLVIFNMLIYLISLRENKEQLLNSEKNKKNSLIFSH